MKSNQGRWSNSSLRQPQICWSVVWHGPGYRRNQLAHELLVGELQHRVGNLFSTIGAVVYATLKAYPEPEAFRKSFDGDSLSLSRTIPRPRSR